MKQQLLITTLLACASVAPAHALTEHTVVDESPLPNGKRIQINVEDVNLSKSDCSAIIDEYRNRAGAEGQISVHKPSTLEELNGAILPFCVDNFDDSGVTFNATFHPEPGLLQLSLWRVHEKAY